LDIGATGNPAVVRAIGGGNCDTGDREGGKKGQWEEAGHGITARIRIN